MDAIVQRVDGTVAVVDWARGTHVVGTQERPNYDAKIRFEQRKLNCLLEEKKVLDKEFEELVLQEEILQQAIDGVRDTIALLDSTRNWQ